MQRTTLTTLVLALGLALSTGTTHGAEIGHYTPGLLNSYLINSPMLPDLKRDADGG